VAIIIMFVCYRRLTIIPCEKSRRAILFNKNKRIKYLKGEQGGKIFDIP
jgi:hypothetical protein